MSKTRLAVQIGQNLMKVIYARKNSVSFALISAKNFPSPKFELLKVINARGILCTKEKN